MQTERVLAERYQIQDVKDVIGKGGMATIYRGRDLRMERVVAIKVLRELYSTDPKFVARFQQEARAASLLEHPNIVHVYDYGQWEGNYFIVMELVEGTDLRRYLRPRGILDVDRAVIIAHDIALGLGAAHRRDIVHRDVKPQNILVGRDGSIKLTDFGIASMYRDMNAQRLTTTGMTLGTVQYYAPEQAQGEIVRPAADVYALGIVMYEMLTGHPPFDGNTPVAVAMQHIQELPRPPRELNPNIPPALEAIILRCLEKVPEMRYSDGSKLARALTALGDNELTENSPSRFTPGKTPVLGSPNSSSPYNQASSRSVGELRNERKVSTPNNMPDVSSSDQGENNIGNGLASNLPAGRAKQQGLASQEPYVSPLPESGTTKPFERNALGGSKVSERDQHDSRFASIITVLILIATLLLLGFSVYLAAVLGYISIPGIHGPAPAVTTGPAQIPVPNLIGLSFDEAQRLAKSQGFVLQVEGSTTGVVAQQFPGPDEKASRGSVILVKLEQGSDKVLVPPGLVGSDLASAIQKLQNAGLKYTIVDKGKDPTQKPNTVVQVDPASGQPTTRDRGVTLFVVNQQSGTSTPTASPTASQTTSPTTTPTVTPTTTPTVTPTTTPTVTPTTTPTVTPTASPTPTPTP